MKHKLATYALLRLHAEIAGKIIKNRDERKRLRRQLDHVDAALHMLQPGINIHAKAAQKRKSNPWFKRGALFRRAVEVLRAARDPMHTREIVWALLRQEGIFNACPLAVADLVKSVERSLVYHRGRSIVAVGTHPVHWKLAD